MIKTVDLSIARGLPVDESRNVDVGLAYTQTCAASPDSGIRDGHRILSGGVAFAFHASPSRKRERALALVRVP